MVVVSIGTKGPSVDWREGGNPFKEPPKGLEPIGDSGWYKSPDNLLPGDPLYCEYNSGSPVCGGNPFSSEGIGISAEVNVDPCGVSARLSGSIAFVKVPEIDLTYRAPGKCRREYEEPPKAPPQEDYGFEAKQAADGFDRDVGDNEIVWAGVTQSLLSKSSYRCLNPDTGQSSFSVELWHGSYVSGLNLSRSTFTYSNELGLHKAETEFQTLKSTVVPNISAACGYKDGEAQEFEPSEPTKLYYSENDDFNQIWTINRNNEIYTRKTVNGAVLDSYSDRNLPPFYSFRVDSQARTLSWLCKGRWGDIKRYFTSLPGKYPEEEKGKWIDIIQCYRVLRPDSSHKNPPYPLSDNRDCCMQCCFSSPSASQNNDDSCCKEVLAIVKRIEKNLGVYPGKVTIFDTNESAKGAQSKVIDFATVSQAFTRTIERVEKIAKIIGIDDLPLTVPKSIVDPADQSIIDLAVEFFTGDTEKINNLFEYHAWFLKQFSAVTGQFMIEIEVPDTDVLQEGEQGVDDDGEQETPPKNKIVIPNLSEGVKEMIMMQVALYKTLGLTLDTGLLNLSQSALCMKEVGRIGAEVDEIVDFLDYPTDDASRDIPVFVTVPGQDLTAEEQNDLIKFLKPSQVKVKYNNWNGRESLRELFIHFASRMGARA